MLGIKVNEIQFSGFWSQGDGASYTGGYKLAPNAVADIKEETGGTNNELLRIAEELTLLQVMFSMEYGKNFAAAISRDNRGHYVHSQMMDILVFTEELNELRGEDTERVQKALRDFADWIYKQLEKEYDYLTSDEALDTRLSDGTYRFEADGTII